MALTVSVLDKVDVGDGEQVVADVSFDSSYPAGGEAITVDDLNFRVRTALYGINAGQVDGFAFEYVPDATLPDRGTIKVRKAASADMALDAAGLAIGTVSKKEVLIANTVNYLSSGEFKQKTTVEVGFTATDDDIPADATVEQECVFLMCLDAAGTPTLTKGTIASGAGNAVVPATPNGLTPIGHVRIEVAIGATDFDATTDDLDAAHLTVTYTDLGTQGDLAEVANGTDLSALTARMVATGR